MDLITTVIESISLKLPDGPYIMQKRTGQIFAVSKLFEDKYQAFIGGSYRLDTPSGSFEWMHEAVNS